MRPDKVIDQYKTCKDCTEYAILEDAGTEMEFVTCKHCGTKGVIRIADYHLWKSSGDKVDDSVDIMNSING